MELDSIDVAKAMLAHSAHLLASNKKQSCDSLFMVETYHIEGYLVRAIATYPDIDLEPTIRSFEIKSQKLKTQISDL